MDAGELCREHSMSFRSPFQARHLLTTILKVANLQSCTPRLCDSTLPIAVLATRYTAWSRELLVFPRRYLALHSSLDAHYLCGVPHDHRCLCGLDAAGKGKTGV